jgi:hypothetical protein
MKKIRAALNLTMLRYWKTTDDPFPDKKSMYATEKQSLSGLSGWQFFIIIAKGRTQ